MVAHWLIALDWQWVSSIIVFFIATAREEENINKIRINQKEGLPGSNPAAKKSPKPEKN